MPQIDLITLLHQGLNTIIFFWGFMLFILNKLFPQYVLQTLTLKIVWGFLNKLIIQIKFYSLLIFTQRIGLGNRLTFLALYFLKILTVKNFKLSKLFSKSLKFLKNFKLLTLLSFLFFFTKKFFFNFLVKKNKSITFIFSFFKEIFIKKAILNFKFFVKFKKVLIKVKVPKKKNYYFFPLIKVIKTKLKYI